MRALVYLDNISMRGFNPRVCVVNRNIFLWLIQKTTYKKCVVIEGEISSVFWVIEYKMVLLLPIACFSRCTCVPVHMSPEVNLSGVPQVPSNLWFFFFEIIFCGLKLTDLARLSGQ